METYMTCPILRGSFMAQEKKDHIKGNEESLLTFSTGYMGRHQSV